MILEGFWDLVAHHVPEHATENSRDQTHHHGNYWRHLGL
jgi:hypothetical protein